MKHILLLCISAAMLITSTTRAQVANKWVKAVPSTEGRALALDLSGNVYVTGKMVNDMLIIKYDSLGNEMWTYTYNGVYNGNDEPSKILVDNSGNVYVSGFTGGGTGGEYALLYKLDASGNLLWADTMQTDPGGSGWNRVYDMSFDNSGNVVLCGSAQSPAGTMGYPTMLVSKHDVNGNELWRDITEVDYAYNYFYNLAVDGSDNIYSVGTEYHGAPGYQFIVRKNGSNGAILWQDIYNVNPSQPDFDAAIDVKIDANNNAYVAGNTRSGGNSDILIRKYDPVGNSLWTKTFSTVTGGNWEETSKLAVTSNGDAYILGRTAPANQTDGQLLLLKYDANGNLVWNQTYTFGMAENGYDIAVDESAGNLIVSCFSRRTSFYVDIVTLKYDLAGNLLWEKRQPSPNQSAPAAAMIGTNHNVYVTGTDGGNFTTIRMMDADASLPLSVTLPGTYDFNTSNVKTGVKADFTSLSNQAQVVVSTLLNSVANTDWCTGTNEPSAKSVIRWFIKSTLDNFAAMLIISLPELSEAIGGYHGMDNPANFSIYQREQDGTGPFCKLVTTFSNGSLSAPITHFSEFFIGSETDTFATTRIASVNKVQTLNIYPNPAVDNSTFEFSLDNISQVDVTISDIQGKIVRNVYSGKMNSGYHKLEIPLEGLSNGIYTCKMAAGDKVSIGKITVIR